MASRSRSNRQELAIDLSRLVGKLPADGYLILTDMPAGTRLSQGHDNGDQTWTVFCDEIPGLKFLPGDIRGVISLNALIFSLDPGVNRAARHLPLVLHTDDAVEWTDRPPVGSDEHGPSTAADGPAMSEPGALPNGPGAVSLAGLPTIASAGSSNPRDQTPPEPKKPNPDAVGSHPVERAAASQSGASGARAGGAALFADAEQRWTVETDRLFRQCLAELRQEAERALHDVEQRHAAEMKELTEAVRKQHGIIAALENATRRAKDEAAARFSAAEEAWRQGEADRIKAAQDGWARQEYTLKGEMDRYRAAAAQLETALLTLKEQSAAKERDAQDRLEHLRKDSDRMLRNARSEWQREVARRLERAGVQILAVFDTEATSQ